MGFTRQEYWSGLLCPPPGDLPDPGIKPTSLMSPALAGGLFTASATWEGPVELYCTSKMKQWSQHHSNPSLCPNNKCQRSWSWIVLWRTTRTSELTPKKVFLFITGDWNAKVGSQEISEITGKFGFKVQNEEGQRLTEFCQENTLVIANTVF